MCRRFPDTTVIIDHLGRIGVDGDDPGRGRRGALRAGQAPEGLRQGRRLLRARQEDAPVPRPRPADPARSSGPSAPSRCMWESDCPFQVVKRPLHRQPLPRPRQARLPERRRPRLAPAPDGRVDPVPPLVTIGTPTMTSRPFARPPAAQDSTAGPRPSPGLSSSLRGVRPTSPRSRTPPPGPNGRSPETVARETGGGPVKEVVKEKGKEKETRGRGEKAPARVVREPVVRDGDVIYAVASNDDRLLAIDPKYDGRPDRGPVRHEDRRHGRPGPRPRRTDGDRLVLGRVPRAADDRPQDGPGHPRAEGQGGRSPTRRLSSRSPGSTASFTAARATPRRTAPTAQPARADRPGDRPGDRGRSARAGWRSRSGTPRRCSRRRKGRRRPGDNSQINVWSVSDPPFDPRPVAPPSLEVDRQQPQDLPFFPTRANRRPPSGARTRSSMPPPDLHAGHRAGRPSSSGRSPASRRGCSDPAVGSTSPSRTTPGSRTNRAPGPFPFPRPVLLFLPLFLHNFLDRAASRLPRDRFGRRLFFGPGGGIVTGGMGVERPRKE